MNQVVVGTSMNQEKPKRVKQVFYNGRWVDKEFFRAFVYSATEQKLAESYKQYEALIGTGLWFDNRELANEAKKTKIEDAPIEVPAPEEKVSPAEVYDFKKSKARKPKNGANS
jgi:hypothetical protein